MYCPTCNTKRNNIFVGAAHQTAKKIESNLARLISLEIVFAVILAFIWFFLIFAMARYLIATDMETSRVISIVAFFAFMPSIIAYGRILGSSWAPLRMVAGC